LHHRSLFPFPLAATLAVALCLPGALGLGAADEDDPPKAADIAAAGKLFRSSCTSCHLPPDPAHETDRAWLNQVKDTA
jgi:mono/diheme cytochrome c family protein